ncbi:type II secretion system protein GspM [uncultured Desulfuromusa sp.]|uniref:type II secretion system protein GspM n=1 Tax=uncultured Desulfuromusa sp. TaxID=219183 RepID=UPI002AA906EA|nr:type II secretion system protein GspM [uncultured Desulfuromusa sp.]
MAVDSSSSLAQWFDQRPQRERIALLICSVAVLLFLFNFLVLQPFSKQRALTQSELTELKTSLADLKSRELEIQGRAENDPDNENRIRLSALEQESEKLQQQLKTNIVDLVSPQEMPGLLKDLLTQQKRLRLLRLENLAPELLELGGPKTEDTTPPTLYRHRLQMEFSGDYLTLLKYLRQLEGLPRSMVWEEVEVKSEDYPGATVRLQVYTLSLTEGWIGG